MSHIIRCIRSADGLNLTLDGKHYYFQNRSLQEMNRIFDLTTNLSKDPDDESVFESLYAVLEPTTYNFSIDNLPPGLDRDDDGHLYLGGLPYPLPPDFEKVVFDYINAGNGADLMPLSKLWARSLCNLDKHPRDAFFGYCMQYGITVTREGYALLYKSVEILPESRYPKGYIMSANSGYREFLSQLKFSADVTGQDPARIMVFYNTIEDKYDSSFCISEDLSEVHIPRFFNTDTWVRQGTLQDLLNIDSLNPSEKEEKVLYIPWYSRSNGRWDDIVEVGVVQQQDRTKCDTDIKRDCSFGLHVGAYKYVQHFGSGVDNVILACLIDPAHVVAIPDYDTSKIRVSEYFPYSVIKRRGIKEWQEVPTGCFEAKYSNIVANDLMIRLQTLNTKIFEDLKEMSRKGIGMDYADHSHYNGGYTSKGYVTKAHQYSRGLTSPEDIMMSSRHTSASIVSQMISELGDYEDNDSIL